MNNLNLVIGKNIKKIRMERGFSLDKLSQLTDVSKTMIGQIERGESSPTINTVWKLAKGLEIPFSALIADRDKEVKVLNRGKMDALPNSDKDYSVFSLVQAGSNKKFELFLTEIAAGKSHISPSHNQGVEEFIVVNSGVAEIRVGDEIFQLNTSDFIQFEANDEHEYKNIGDSLLSLTVLIHYS
ncbi:helix-turn-helix domain-containing protein [Enterococcus sp. AZ109]|uniref:helix-turn-helix domain-containing protein n=1 Tax=Enterococcus sp. AZ109 TaxID=2774634 RepID=UPI003F224AA1